MNHVNDPFFKEADDVFGYSNGIANYKSSPHTMFATIENALIYYSCFVNAYALPVGLYSWIHAQYGFDRYVETSISLIQQTIAPLAKPTSVYGKIKDTLESFRTGTDDYTFGANEYSGIDAQIELKVYYENIKPSTMLKFYSYVGVLPDDVKEKGGYTIITADEYYYLLESVNRWNLFGSFSDPIKDGDDYLVIDCNEICQKDHTPGETKSLNFCTLLNLYAYLKMQINRYDNISNSDLTAGYKIYMRETVNTLAEKMRKGNRTISRYLNILIELGMIGINGHPQKRISGSYIRNKHTHYWLSDKWIGRLIGKGYIYAEL